jgi:hypothetical protein
MATMMHAKVRPQITDDYGATSKQRTIGIGLAIVGMALAVVTLIANLSAAGDGAIRSSVLPWSFGLTTTAFAVIKTAIVVILWGILMKIWMRVDVIKATLAQIVRVDEGATFSDGEYESPYGRALMGHTEPAELAIHKMAKQMWAPMAVMGLMAVVIGLFTSFAWAGGGGIVSSSWTQGIQFLGEGMLLASISFVLGTILWAIRTGGSEVQSSLGVAVKTLKMPVTAKVFVGLMMLGLMAAIAQFVLYLVVAGGGVTGANAWLAWLGPLRELALALILSGIAMALVTIGNVLSFQFDRISELVRTGK